MHITLENGYFVFHCKFEERETAKKLGFRWDIDKRKWCTTEAHVAAKSHHICDGEAKAKIRNLFIRKREWKESLITPSHLELKEFQKTATLFALERNRSYLALDCGLGKSIIACAIQNSLKSPTVFVCPPFLLSNIQNEITKWCPGVTLHTSASAPKFINGIWLIPYSMVYKDEYQKSISQFLYFYNKVERSNTTLICDEAQYLKNSTAKRTKAVLSFANEFDKVVFLSGTPMPNRPMELFSILSTCAPETINFKNMFEYGQRYCGPKIGFQGRWDYSGASHVEELSSNVKDKFMLRLRKRDVLKELPEVVEETIILSASLPPALREMDRHILAKYTPDELVKKQIKEVINLDTGEPLHIETYRRELGKLKAESITDFINEIMNNTDESILLFAIHREVIDALDKALKKHNPLVITGATPVLFRQKLVDEFQVNPARRILIGNISAMGTGFNITKASRVIFAETSWVPGENEQAVSRADRIGQQNVVICQYLVYANSVDASVLQTVLRKKEEIRKI